MLKSLKTMIGVYLLLIFSAAFPQEIADQNWRQVKSFRGIATQAGLTAPSVYVFFDPNCPWCAKLWSTKVDDVAFSEFPAVWIPVTYLSESSLGMGAALLRAPTKQSLEENFSKFNYDWRRGGIAPVEPTEAERLALGKAKTVWLKLGGGTPMFVYRDRKGNARRFIGLPPAAELDQLVKSFAPSKLSAYPSK